MKTRPSRDVVHDLARRWFGFLRVPVDVDEISRHAADHLARSCVGGGDGIERLRFGALGHHQASAVPADLIVGDLEFFA